MLPADELKAVLALMREFGVADMASGDTRIIMAPGWVPKPEGADLSRFKGYDAADPLYPQQSPMKQDMSEDDEDALMYAAVGGPP
jgi:hypothetical protein